MAFVLIANNTHSIRDKQDTIIDIRDDSDFGACKNSTMFKIVEFKNYTKKQIESELDRIRPVVNTGDKYTDMNTAKNYRAKIKDEKAAGIADTFEMIDLTTKEAE